mgnify:CR=1 FL=1
MEINPYFSTSFRPLFMLVAVQLFLTFILYLNTKRKNKHIYQLNYASTSNPRAGTIKCLIVLNDKIKMWLVSYLKEKPSCFIHRNCIWWAIYYLKQGKMMGFRFQKYFKVYLYNLHPIYEALITFSAVSYKVCKFLS